jgi:selenium metabolism protein YedF
MSTHIDAKGKACPIPFMLAKAQIDAGATEFIVEVDNKAAVENLKRLAKSQAFSTSVEENDNTFNVAFLRSGEQQQSNNPLVQPAPDNQSAADYVVFIGDDSMGPGTHELGRNLIRMFLYTLDQGSKLPSSVILMNNGVKLAVDDEHCIGTFKSLQQKGVEVMVCGTCLNFYHLLDRLQIGTVGNMYEITQRFVSAGKVITV